MKRIGFRLLPGVLCAVAVFCAACTASPSTPPRAADPDTRRDLVTGPVVGFKNPKGGDAWLGIPYAAPPVGDRRWHAPAPASRWTEQRAALVPGSPCVQFGWALGGVGADGTRQGSEDCLYLNVYAPHVAREHLSDTRLPVMVWIHGGSNTVGQAAFYDGGRLASTRQVLVVMVNYRLGPFGWFVVPSQGEPDTIEASGNWGNLDILAALRWVQENAAAFGGDPQNVTVFGESAGATDALHYSFRH